MLTLRRSTDRGRAEFGWLDSHHTFSFGEYHDSKHMGFGPLRVINEDRVQPGKGFGTHSHKDMEIISYVLEGALEHKDSMGNGSVIRPGDVQRMYAGTGVQHSEFNHSKSEPVHFLQIWILPDQAGLDPGYSEKRFPDEDKNGALKLIVSGDGRADSISIHQDLDLYTALLGDSQSVEHRFAPDRIGWVQVARGRVRIGDADLEAGDGAAIENEERMLIEALAPSEILLFDMVA
jgi:redox-sensitive bicupin YhaK (pirin superfamily)